MIHGYNSFLGLKLDFFPRCVVWSFLNVVLIVGEHLLLLWAVRDFLCFFPNVSMIFLADLDKFVMLFTVEMERILIVTSWQ